MFVETGVMFLRSVRNCAARLTMTPARLTIAPHSRGLFRLRAELEERLLYRKCGKDIEFLLRVLRQEDHAQEPRGASKIVIKPRFRTKTVLNGELFSARLHLFGHVNPYVGAQDVLLEVERPGEQTLWTTVDLELEASFPFNTVARAVAYYDGSFEYAKSVSNLVVLHLIQEG